MLNFLVELREKQNDHKFLYTACFHPDTQSMRTVNKKPVLSANKSDDNA